MADDEKINAAEGGVEHKVLQTYAEDVAKVIEGDRAGGLIKKLIHEDKARELEKRNLSPESKKNRFFILTGVLLIIMALATLFFYILNKDITTVPVADQFVPIIFNDKSVFVEVKDFDKDKISQTVRNEVNNSEVKTGGVEGIYLTEDKIIIGLRKFIALIKGSYVPGNLALVKDDFMLGAVNSPAQADASSDKDFFVLIKMRTLPDIFDTLRAWENKMFFDLHGFFGKDISADTDYLLTKDFEDGLIENKNARILYDNDRNIMLMYIFADNNSVIVSDSIPAAREIILRVAASEVKQ